MRKCQESWGRGLESDEMGEVNRTGDLRKKPNFLRSGRPQIIRAVAFHKAGEQAT